MELVTKQKGEITQFNPEQTSTEIHQLEGIEKMCRKAKDADKLKLAIEEKLKRQREFVLWWASEERRGRPEKGHGSGTILKDFGLVKQTIDNWRSRLTDPEKYENYKTEAIVSGVD